MTPPNDLLMDNWWLVSQYAPQRTHWEMITLTTNSQRVALGRAHQHITIFESMHACLKQVKEQTMHVNNVMLRLPTERVRHTMGCLLDNCMAVHCAEFHDYICQTSGDFDPLAYHLIRQLLFEDVTMFSMRHYQLHTSQRYWRVVAYFLICFTPQINDYIVTGCCELSLIHKRGLSVLLQILTLYIRITNELQYIHIYTRLQQHSFSSWLNRPIQQLASVVVSSWIHHSKAHYHRPFHTPGDPIQYPMHVPGEDSNCFILHEDHSIRCVSRNEMDFVVVDQVVYNLLLEPVGKMDPDDDDLYFYTHYEMEQFFPLMEKDMTPPHYHVPMTPSEKTSSEQIPIFLSHVLSRAQHGVLELRLLKYFHFPLQRTSEFIRLKNYYHTYFDESASSPEMDLS